MAKPTTTKKTETKKTTRERVLMFRATDAEASKIEAAARKEGLQVAAWVRRAVLLAAQRGYY